MVSENVILCGKRPALVSVAVEEGSWRSYLLIEGASETSRSAEIGDPGKEKIRGCILKPSVR